MLYAIEEQRTIKLRLSKALAASSAQSLTVLTSSRFAAQTQIAHIPQTLSVIAGRQFNKSVTVTSPQTVTRTHTPVTTPRIFQSLAKSARIFQPGNLQVGPALRVNWLHPLSRGLVYLDVFDQMRSNADDYPMMPKFIGSRPALTIRSGTSVRAGPGGNGITTSSVGGMMTASGNTVKMPQTAGTIFFYVTADFAAGDSAVHYLFVIGRETAGSEQDFALVKFSDNTSIFGWITNGVSSRAIVASSGLWAAGDTFMYGGTWNPSNVNLFIKGKLAGSFGSAPTTNDTTTASAAFRLFQASTGNQGWGTTLGKNFIYYMGIWNRDLTTAECNYLNQNPYCFMTTHIPRP